MIALVPRHGTKNPIFGVLAHGLKGWTEDLDARKMEAFQLNTIKSKKEKM